jgi:hypothetical protein
MKNSDKTIFYTDPSTGYLVSLALSDKCTLTPEQIAEKDVPDKITYKILDTATVPTNYDFRDAWTYTDSKFGIDITKAREIHKNNIRYARTLKFAELDIEFQKAQETSADTSAIVDKKNALRNAPADNAIDAATDVAGLKAQWNTSLLGTSPYT